MSGGGGGGNARRTAAAAPLGNYEFDFGNLGRGSGKTSLSGLKQQAPPSSSPAPPKQAQAQAPPKQAWVHKPAAGITGMSSMVGDISGKSWVPLDPGPGSRTWTNPSNTSGVVGGVGSSKADLFSDLLKMGSGSTTSKPSSQSAPLGNSRSSGQPLKDFVSMVSPPPPTAAAAGLDKLFQPPPPSSSSQDPFDDLLQKISKPPPAAPATNSSRTFAGNTSSINSMMNSKNFINLNTSSTNGVDDDDWDREFQGAASATAATTELDGLPPPPAGVTPTLAQDKAVGFQRQGQFADAIKWLSWAVVLLDESPDKLKAVLVTRASCYKEVGDYKKAVADCCKVLEIAGPSSEVLLQRAFLYESMEKYKLSVQDLREALKMEPSNSKARNTLARLAKMVD